MTSQEVKAASSQNPVSKGQAKDPNRTELGKEQFLGLLMAQLGSQDPLNPADSTEFVAQLSQFASLEQLTNLGQRMDDLVTISGASNAANAVSLLGKEVRVDGNKIQGPRGLVFYDLDAPAKSGKLEVLNKKGEIVRSVTDIPLAKGLNELEIKDLPEGEYTVRLKALDEKNAEMEPNLSVGEKVRAVAFNGPTPTVIFESGKTLLASNVIEIREPK